MVPTTTMYDARPTLWSSAILRPLVPGAHIVMSPFDAGSRGLTEGMKARVRAEDGTSMAVTVRVRDGITPGVVLAPERMGGDAQPAELLGGDAWASVTVEAEGAT
jgi:anaerobic selenocysteine-containing dehydrogenase